LLPLYFSEEEREKLWHVAIKRKSQVKEFNICMLANVNTHYRLRSQDGEFDEIEYFKNENKILILIDDITDIEKVKGEMYKKLPFWKKAVWKIRNKLNQILT
jgi:hypothetical protein